MLKINKLIIPILTLCLLTGCGKKDKADDREEERTDTALTQIEYIPGLSFPVYEEDYESNNQFDKVMMNGSDDTLFFGLVKDDGEGVETNYNNNKDDYQTPYLFGAAEDSFAPYKYYSYGDLNYGSKSLSFTEKQFELYDKDNYVYEVGIPTTRNDNLYLGNDYTNTPTSLKKITDVKAMAEVLESVSFIHIRDINITSDIKDMSEDEVIKKVVKTRLGTLDNTTLYGIIVAIEYRDQQYFYVMGEDKEPSDDEIAEIISQIEPNEADIYDLFKETADRTEPKSVSFDVNGVAGTLEVPGYFRTSEINNNIYSNALLFVAESNRYKDNPVSMLPNNYGASEVLLKNEYLNTAMTFNNFRKNENITNEKDFILHYYNFVVYGLTPNMRETLDNYDMSKSDNIIIREPVTDKDGNTWNSYIIYNQYIKMNENYPKVIPYGRHALIYTRDNGDYVEMFTFSSAAKYWYLSENLCADYDNVVKSFTRSEASTELPNTALTFYPMPTEETATETDAEEVPEEPEEEPTTEAATEATTEAAMSDEEIFEELGITQEDIDNAPMITDEE